LVIAITPFAAWLYRRFFLRAKLQVSLAPLLEIEMGLAGGNPPTQHVKSQAFLLTAKRGPIHNCKVKFVLDQHPEFLSPQYMSWHSREEVEETQPPTLSRDLIPEEQIRLTIWDAYKRPDGESLQLNAGKDIFDRTKNLGGEPLIFGVTFLSDAGPLNKKPYRYKIRRDSWATMSMDSIK